MLLYRVVIGFPAFQFLKAEKTLGQIRLVLGRAVDEASLRHSLWGAGAVLQEGPVLEGGDAVVFVYKNILMSISEWQKEMGGRTYFTVQIIMQKFKNI